MNLENKARLERLVVSVVYQPWDCVSIKVAKHGEDNWWVTDQSTSMGGMGFNFMDGTKGGGAFKSREAAEAEVVRIIEHFQAPLTSKEIRRHFSARWIRREEQKELLAKFKQALLDGRWKRAADIYNTAFSSWTKEAIPAKVHVQIGLHI